ncbi:hypothetical protein FF2_018715 [Malus domestica]
MESWRSWFSPLLGPGYSTPCRLLEKIPDSGIRKMILHMIQLEPELRLSADSYLQELLQQYNAIIAPPGLHLVKKINETSVLRLCILG